MLSSVAAKCQELSVCQCRHLAAQTPFKLDFQDSSRAYSTQPLVDNKVVYKSAFTKRFSIPAPPVSIATTACLPFSGVPTINPPYFARPRHISSPPQPPQPPPPPPLPPRLRPQCVAHHRLLLPLGHLFGAAMMTIIFPRYHWQQTRGVHHKQGRGRTITT